MTSRIYKAIAAGCLPVIVCDGYWQGPFFQTAMIETFVVRVSHMQFNSDPMALLQTLRAMSRSGVRARQQAMAAYSADVLYARNDSRVGWNFLEDATRRCFPSGGSCASPAPSWGPAPRRAAVKV